MGWLRDFTTRKAKKEKKGGKRKAEATKLLMLPSFIGTILPSEEKDGLKVDEETKKNLQNNNGGLADQIASLGSLRDSFIIQWKYKSFSSKPWVSSCGTFIVCDLCAVRVHGKERFNWFTCGVAQSSKAGEPSFVLPCMHRTMPASKGIEGIRVGILPGSRRFYAVGSIACTLHAWSAARSRG